MADNTTKNVDTSTPEVVTEEIDLESAEPNKTETAAEESEGLKSKEDKSAELKSKEDKTTETRAFSERLKKAREDDLKKIEALEKEIKSLKPLIAAAKRLGYKGTPDEIAANLIADHEGKTVDEIKSEMADEEARYLERKKNDPDFLEVERLKEEIKAYNFERQQLKDYAAIKSAYPELKAKNMVELVKELGQDFADKLDRGYDPVDAYESVIKKRAKTVNPVNIGSTKSSGSIANNDVFTIEQINAMTSEERLKNMNKILKSLEQKK